jgi:ABC-type uncharacterized transport system substrate-binding protein
MTQSAEDSARAILRVFSSEDVRAGHALMYEAVKLQFLKSCSAEDFAAGLAFAINYLSFPVDQEGTRAGLLYRHMKPSDIPVEQPTKFNLVISLITARTLNLAIPPAVLALADEVIE